MKPLVAALLFLLTTSAAACGEPTEHPTCFIPPPNTQQLAYCKPSFDEPPEVSHRCYLIIKKRKAATMAIIINLLLD